MKQLSMYEEVTMYEELSMYEAPSMNEEIHQQAPRQASLNIFTTRPAEHTSTPRLSKESRFTPNVTEIVLTGDKFESIQLILPMLINLHREQRWLAWIDPPVQILKEWQKAHNDKALNEIMLLRSNENFSVFELSKRALEAGTCHAVIAWTDTLNQDEFSKLETASAQGNSHGIILRSRSTS